MRTLTNNELHRLRHIVAEQANTAQARGFASDDGYLSLTRFDAQDVADALEELVALRTQEEDAARETQVRQAIVESRVVVVDASLEDLEESLRTLCNAVDCLREAVEG